MSEELPKLTAPYLQDHTLHFFLGYLYLHVLFCKADSCPRKEAGYDSGIVGQNLQPRSKPSATKPFSQSRIPPPPPPKPQKARSYKAKAENPIVLIPKP